MIITLLQVDMKNFLWKKVSVARIGFSFVCARAKLFLD